MANIPNFNELANYRYNGFTGDITPILIGYGANPTEDRTIPASAPYIILLHESPQFNIPSTTRIWDVTDGVWLTEVSKTTAVANRQFRVNYDERGNGQVEFNGAQKSHSIEIGYYGEGSLAKIETLQATLDAITSAYIETITTDTTLDDDQGNVGMLQLEFDCRTGDKEVILPKANLNEGFQIGVTQLYKGGRGAISGKTGDTINGYSSIYVDDIGNGGRIYSNGTEWKIIGKWEHTIKYFEDERPNADWTATSTGSLRIKYDNKVGAFILGEVLIESDTLLEFILMYDDGTYLYVKNAEGNATDNKVLTGQTSGAHCDVNEATGSTKNLTMNIYHFTNLKIFNLNPIIFVSTDGTEATRRRMAFDAMGQTNIWGFQQWGIDANSFTIQTANAYFGGLLSNIGGIDYIQNDDYMYSLYLEVLY